MPGEILQHVVVTLMALVAGVTIIRRVLGFVGLPAQRRTGCACPSGTDACGASGASPTSAGATVHHVAVLTKPPTVGSSVPHA